MKRSNLNIGLLLAVSLAVINFTSCNRDEPEKRTGFVIQAENIIGNTSNVATVKFVDYEWNETLQTVINYTVLAQAPFVNNGFRLTLPAVLPDELLVLSGALSDGWNVGWYPLFWFDALNANGDDIGFMWLRDENDQLFYDVSWLYADRDGSSVIKLSE